MEPGEFEGVAGRTLEDSTPWWPDLPSAPEGAPNVVVVLLDDVGYAQFGCYGSDIATPTFDRLAADGLRYSQLPHHRAVLADARLPAHRPQPPRAAAWAASSSSRPASPATTRRCRRRTGSSPRSSCATATRRFAVGKWHLAPARTRWRPARPRARWPLGRGFERFYGFLGGETDQYHPDLVHDNHQIDPPRTPEEGYHLTEDLADHAIGYLTDLRAVVADRAVLPLLHAGRVPRAAPGARARTATGTRARSTTAGTRGARRSSPASRRVGPAARGHELSERPHVDRRRGTTLSDDERRLYARMMEVFAGFLEHTDAQVGRVLDFIESLGELDNTIVVDHERQRAPAPRAVRAGSFNENYFFNMVSPRASRRTCGASTTSAGPTRTTTTRGAGRGPGNTPLKRWKRETHEGGVTDPLIVHWPAGLGQPGETRHQYVHAIDVLPTLLDVIGIEPPDDDRRRARSSRSTARASRTRSPTAPPPSRHVTQYYEMLGCRAIYHDGWKAVDVPPADAGFAYDGSATRGGRSTTTRGSCTTSPRTSPRPIDLADEGARAARRR